MKKIGLLILLIILGIFPLATIHLANASSSYTLRVRWLKFNHEKSVMDDYIFQAEFEIPAIGHYESKRTPCARYLSEFTPLEFNVQESWLNLSASLTIAAFWHLDDVIIDINPSSLDGRWTPFGKKASASVLSYKIGNDPTQCSADGNDDGYLADLNNDAHIRFVVETLKDGEVIPEFPSIIIIPLLMMATLLAVIVYRRKQLIRDRR